VRGDFFALFHILGIAERLQSHLQIGKKAGEKKEQGLR
jgi:hypothetical protein